MKFITCLSSLLKCTIYTTLLLQLSKCILGQWPLKTIKCYESTGRGHFGFEAGKLAPMGEGRYNFSTRVSQDTMIYDYLDKFVMEAAGLREVNYFIISTKGPPLSKT